MGEYAGRLGFLTAWDGPPAVTDYSLRLLEALLDAQAAVTLLGPASSPALHGAWRRAAKRCAVVALPWEVRRLDPRPVLAVCREWGLRHLLIQYHPAWFAPSALTALAEHCAECRINCAVTLHAQDTLTADQLHPLDRAGATLVVPTAALCEDLLDQGIIHVVRIPPGVPDVPPESAEAARELFGVAQGPVLGVAGEFSIAPDLLLQVTAILRELYPDVLLLQPVNCAVIAQERTPAPWVTDIERLRLTQNVRLGVRCSDAEEMLRAYRACDLLLLLPNTDEATTLAATHLAIAARKPLAAVPPWDVPELREAVYSIQAADPAVVALAAANILWSPLLQEALIDRVSRYAQGKSWHDVAAAYSTILLQRHDQVAA